MQAAPRLRDIGELSMKKIQNHVVKRMRDREIIANIRPRLRNFQYKKIVRGAAVCYKGRDAQGFCSMPFSAVSLLPIAPVTT